MKLLEVLFPHVRAEVLRLLFADEGRELHLRELTRQSGLSLGTLQTEVKKLCAADLLVSRRDGNRLCFRANAAHPLFTDLRQLVLKTAGLREVLADALRHVPGTELAFVFGSLAAGSGKAGSDVDLMIVGEASLRALAPPLRKAAEQLGREINPVTMTRAEFSRDRAKKPFLREVLAKEKLFIKGNIDELARLG
jgi:predicted nucleotidyltransferase